MLSNKSVECGLEYRKYLYIVGILAIVGLAGSYWYLNYFLDEIGIDSEKALKATRDMGRRGVAAIAEIPGTPVQSAPPSMVQAQPAGFWPPAANAATAPTDQESFSTVVRSILPSVVNVSTQNRAAPFQSAAGPANPAVANNDGVLKFASPYSGVAMESIGSGVIVSADGYVISNFHVVENAQNIFVTVFGALGTQRYPAEVIRLDPARDLVLLKINVPLPLQPAPLGNSDLIQVGDPVITVGCPFGLDQTVSKGIISGARKAVTIEGVVHKDLIQTDAAINQGNSGGPLVSRFGYVIGINTAIYSPTQAFSGVGFAVPVNAMREFLSEVIALPEVTPAMAQQGWNGQSWPVAAKRMPPPPIPANAVAPHGDRGACESCHVILPAGQLAHLPASTFGIPGGANGLNVALATANAPAGQPAVNPTPGVKEASVIGAEFKALDDVLIQRFKPPFSNGVFVQGIMPGSAAEMAGMQVGDILFKLDGRWLRTPDELQTRLKTYAVGDKARFSLVRKQMRMDLNVTIAPPPVNVAQPLPAAAPPPVAPPTPGAPAKAAPPAPTEFEWMGMELQPIQAAMAAKTPALKDKKGAVIQEIDPGLQADQAGVLANDIVIAINSQPVSTNVELDKAIQASATAKTILLDVERGGKRMFVTLK
ncbi:MAG: trypsin-like peptidase domain-containing protein [Magnetococcales bacterium]|nr:trypsin-like peptidase domain-containing protein [Magnetococcales bacterium]